MNEELTAKLEEYNQRLLKNIELLEEASEIQKNTIVALQKSCEKLKEMNNMWKEMNEFLKAKVESLERENKVSQDLINSQAKVIAEHVVSIHDLMDRILLNTK